MQRVALYYNTTGSGFNQMRVNDSDTLKKREGRFPAALYFLQDDEIKKENRLANSEKEQIHAKGVSQYCFLISSALSLSERINSQIRFAGLLHDIGKITIPSYILNKPGKLTDEEFEIIKKHPVAGYQLLKPVDDAIANYILHHHERWDGKGYPTGLKGVEIQLQSRIIAVADAFEAMTSERVYQRKKTIGEAKAELRKYSGSQFDPMIVEIFLDSVLYEAQQINVSA